MNYMVNGAIYLVYIPSNLQLPMDLNGGMCIQTVLEMGPGTTYFTLHSFSVQPTFQLCLNIPGGC